MEFKGPKTKLSKWQERFIKEANKDGNLRAVVVRSGNIVEDHEGNEWFRFDGSAGELLEKLAELTEVFRQRSVQ